MYWLVQACGTGTGDLGVRAPPWLSSGISLPWKWLLADGLRVILVLCSVTFIVGWLICMQEAKRMTKFFKKACVWGNGWSPNPESEPEGWLNINCKTSWSLKWINGSDIGIRLCQGFYPRPASFPSSLSLQSGDLSLTAQRRDCMCQAGDCSPLAVTGTRCGRLEQSVLPVGEHVWILTDFYQSPSITAIFFI